MGYWLFGVTVCWTSYKKFFKVKLTFGLILMMAAVVVRIRLFGLKFLIFLGWLNNQFTISTNLTSGFLWLNSLIMTNWISTPLTSSKRWLLSLNKQERYCQINLATSCWAKSWSWRQAYAESLNCWCCSICPDSSHWMCGTLCWPYCPSYLAC